MSVFNYYTEAFGKFRDYQNIATRKEFNYFILFFFIFYMIIGFITGIITPIFIISKINPADITLMMTVPMWIYSIIHLLPLLALVKRRLNDIFPVKSSIVFSIFFTYEFFRIIFSLFLSSKYIDSAFKTPTPEIDLTMIGFYLLNYLLSLISCIFYIFLMAKKGKN